MSEIKKSSNIKRLLSYVQNASLYFGFIGIFCIIDAVFVISIAFALKFMVTAAMTSDGRLLIDIIVLLCSTTVTICILEPILWYFIMKAVKKAVAEIRRESFLHLISLPMGYFEKNGSGDVLSRTTNDISSLEYFLGEGMKSIVYSVTLSVGSIGFMIALNWKISLVVLGISFVCYISNRIFSGPFQRTGDLYRKLVGKLTQGISNVLAGFSVMRLFGLDRILGIRFQSDNDRVAMVLNKQNKSYAALEGINFLNAMFGFTGMIAIGSFMVYSGKTDFGTLTTMVQLHTYLTMTVLGIAGMTARIQNVLASSRRVLSLLDDETEIQSSEGHQQGSDYSIELKDLVFSYDFSKVLDNLCLSFEAGKTSALVGPSGGGKTTILKLLLGFYPVQSGNVLIGGKKIEDYGLNQLREMMSYVSQDAYLFDGSIGENIRIGKSSANDTEVEAAASAAFAHEFIMEFPDGYMTEVGEGGSKLSGGQKQRISLARAILKDAPILLLDEATSALDSKSEALVQKALNTLMKNKTVIAVAHRLSTIEKADMIYVIDEGKVAEAGKHEDLIRNNGLYAAIGNLPG